MCHVDKLLSIVCLLVLSEYLDMGDSVIIISEILEFVKQSHKTDRRGLAAAGSIKFTLFITCLLPVL
jgi:hypothetical protein